MKIHLIDLDVKLSTHKQHKVGGCRLKSNTLIRRSISSNLQSIIFLTSFIIRIKTKIELNSKENTFYICLHRT